MSHNHDGESDVECPMIMTFHTGSCESILFKSITVNTVDAFALAVFVIFLISIAYEGIKFWREKLYNDYANLNAINCSTVKGGTSDNRKTIRQLLTNKTHLIQTVMHLIQVTVSYCLMLVVMTFNIWLILGVILGATAGYFLFGWIRQRSIDMSEQCCH